MTLFSLPVTALDAMKNEAGRNTFGEVSGPNITEPSEGPKMLLPANIQSNRVYASACVPS